MLAALTPSAVVFAFAGGAALLLAPAWWLRGLMSRTGPPTQQERMRAAMIALGVGVLIGASADGISYAPAIGLVVAAATLVGLAVYAYRQRERDTILLSHAVTPALAERFLALREELQCTSAQAMEGEINRVHQASGEAEAQACTRIGDPAGDHVNTASTSDPGGEPALP